MIDWKLWKKRCDEDRQKLGKDENDGEITDEESSSDDSSIYSDYTPDESDNGNAYSTEEGSSGEDHSDQDLNEGRRYPRRQRIQRKIPGAVSWDQVDL